MKKVKFLTLYVPCCKQTQKESSMGILKASSWKTFTDNAHCFTLYLNYTSRKVILLIANV